MCGGSGGTRESNAGSFTGTRPRPRGCGSLSAHGLEVLVGDRAGGPEAAAYAKRVLTAQTVPLVNDPTQDGRDRYQRTLAYQALAGGGNDGGDYSLMAAGAGVARASTYEHRPVEIVAQITAAVQRAQAAHRGLWGAHCYGSTAPAAAASSPIAPTSSGIGVGGGAGFAPRAPAANPPASRWLPAQVAPRTTQTVRRPELQEWPLCTGDSLVTAPNSTAMTTASPANPPRAYSPAS